MKLGICILFGCVLLASSCNTNKVGKETKLTSVELMELTFNQHNHEKAVVLAKNELGKNKEAALKILRRSYTYLGNADSAIYYFEESKKQGFSIDNKILAKAFVQDRQWKSALGVFENTNNNAGKIYTKMKEDNSLKCPPTNGGVSAEYEFDASSSIDPVRPDIVFKWDFGNGMIKEGAKVSHVFTEMGEHKVTFFTYDPITKQVHTPEKNNESTPNPFIVNVRKGFDIIIVKRTMKVQGKKMYLGLKDASVGKTYIWSMGDGTIIEGTEVEHTYFGHGSFNCRVYELDKNGTVNNCNVQDFSIGPVPRFAKPTN